MHLHPHICDRPNLTCPAAQFPRRRCPSPSLCHMRARTCRSSRHLTTAMDPDGRGLKEDACAYVRARNLVTMCDVNYGKPAYIRVLFGNASHNVLHNLQVSIAHHAAAPCMTKYRVWEYTRCLNENRQHFNHAPYPNMWIAGCARIYIHAPRGLSGLNKRSYPLRR